MLKVKICVLADFYLPGYKAGGPIRTLTNMVDRLGDEFHFKIITSDRDIGDTRPYRAISVDVWNSVGKTDVLYVSKKQRSLRSLKRLLCSIEYDILYLNSFFSPDFTIKPLILRRLRLIPERQLVIAPRGELSTGALGMKGLKKRVYITAARALALYKGSVCQASSEREETYIRQRLVRGVRVVVAPDLPSMIPAVDGSVASKEKSFGCLRLLFLSRISRMKNLDGALEMLRRLNGDVQFDIYGPVEDGSYWAECQKIISTLPDSIQVRYRGNVKHEKVGDVMREYDVFFLPTLGENFGHVILEALCAGCPVIISDQTPWRNLEGKGVGWDLELRNTEKFRNVLRKCVEMENEEYAKWSERAKEYGMQVIKDGVVVEQNRKLFLAE